MKKVLKHFEFPKLRPGLKMEEVFFSRSESKEYLDYCYNKNTSAYAISIANQYFSIEEILIESFFYVTPIRENKSTSSARFATIIRESCNLYELLCKSVYNAIFDYDVSRYKLDIYNYLSLERFLQLSKEELRTATFQNYLENDERLNPFISVKDWSGQLKLEAGNIPDWWHAYNSIKHDAESMVKNANQYNAILSTAAIFLLIRKIYGDGLISGYLRKPAEEENVAAIMYPIRASKVFIGEIYKAIVKSVILNTSRMASGD